MKRVVLIQPLILGYEDKPYIPHSLLYLAAAVRQHSDVRCDIVDYNVGDTVDACLGNEDLLFYGITSLTGSQLCSAEAIARKIRSRRPEVPLVWGGIHATLARRETISESYVDVVVKGEGEETVNDLIRAYLTGRDLGNIAGILYKTDGRVHESPDRPPLDMDTLAPPAYEAIELSRYNTDVLWMNTSRSCPHRCTFCCNSGYRQEWRGMSAERIMAQLRACLRMIDPGGVFFTDYNFFVDRDRIRRLAEYLIADRLDVRWMAHIVGSDASQLEPEYVRLLKRSGCVSLITGQDSSRRRMRAIGKPATHEQIQAAGRTFAQQGLSLTRNFILGLPGEEYEDVRSTVDDIADLRSNCDEAINIYVFCAWPGTPIIERLRRTPYQVPVNTGQWSRLIPGDADGQVFHPPRHRRLIRTVYYVLRSVYSMRVLPRLPEGGGGRIRPLRRYERVLLRLLSAAAAVRWRLRLFAFGIECELFHLLVKRRYQQFAAICRRR